MARPRRIIVSGDIDPVTAAAGDKDSGAPLHLLVALGGAVWHDKDGGTVTSYAYYPWGQMRSLSRAGFERQYAYTADGQRVVTRDPGTGRLTVTLRGLDTKVRRVVERQGPSGPWTWVKDYVTRGGLQVGSVDNAGEVRHFYLDHLGSIRQISTGEGRHAVFHAYFPFGEEAPPIEHDGEVMKFTGHERDFNGSNTATMQHLDYMHARYYNPNLARFLTIDPGRDNDPSQPQSWNLYAYTRGNPMKYVDPDGRAVVVVVIPAWAAYLGLAATTAAVAELPAPGQPGKTVGQVAGKSIESAFAAVRRSFRRPPTLDNRRLRETARADRQSGSSQNPGDPPKPVPPAANPLRPNQPGHDKPLPAGSRPQDQIAPDPPSPFIDPLTGGAVGAAIVDRLLGGLRNPSETLRVRRWTAEEVLEALREGKVLKDVPEVRPDK